MRVLLTNDDGIDAPGLQALIEAIPDDLETFVVAPLRPMSECGHRVTTRAPLAVEKRGPERFAVDGTPADCVRVALTRLMEDRPDVIFSGINSGGNLGVDVFISGTVAAVREGVFHEVPGIALSHHLRDGRRLDWEWASRCAVQVIGEWREAAENRAGYWNVNLPHLKETSGPAPERVFCEPSRHPLPVAFREDEDGRLIYCGKYNRRQGEERSDVAECFRGKIAITRFSR
ncbi:MAG: 5'/3'-nucleotidase SurE, partial [Verrucomicrobiota bacterium]